MINTNLKELTSLTQEAAALAAKRQTPEEKRRFVFLTGTAIPAVKAGATIAEVDQERLNEVELRNGFRPSKIERPSVELRTKAAFMKALVNVKDSREIRANEVEGAPMLAHFGSYTSLGNFVPTGWLDQVFSTMASVDPLIDPSVCNVIISKKATPLPIPTLDDVGNDAVQVGENALSGTDTLFSNPNHVTVGAYSFCSPIHPFSMEIFDDLEAAGNAFDFFAKFAGERAARGIGKKLITGTGGGTTINGILNALSSLSVTGVTAVGSADNTGGTETGATSIGSADLAALYFTVAEPYRYSDKSAWLMNDSTLQYVSKLVSKMGLPVVSVVDGLPTIMGRSVRVSPSMPNIGANNVPVVFGDLSYFTTRIVVDDITRIAVVREAPGLVENGLVGLRFFIRADGALCFNSANVANCPVQPLINSAS
jgi:HK97 family phage major capsid protein